MATKNKLEILRKVAGGFEKSKWIQEAESRSNERTEQKARQMVALHILRVLRQRNMSQKQLAEMLGVSPQQVNKWVKGSENFSIGTLVKLQTALKVKLFQVIEPTQALRASSKIVKTEHTYVEKPGPPVFPTPVLSIKFYHRTLNRPVTTQHTQPIPSYAN